MVVFVQSECIRAKVVLIGKSGCIRQKWFYSGKVVVIGQSRLVRAKWLFSGKNGCIWAKWV